MAAVDWTGNPNVEERPVHGGEIPLVLVVLCFSSPCLRCQLPEHTNLRKESGCFILLIVVRGSGFSDLFPDHFRLLVPTSVRLQVQVSRERKTVLLEQ